MICQYVYVVGVCTVGEKKFSLYLSAFLDEIPVIKDKQDKTNRTLLTCVLHVCKVMSRKKRVTLR